MCAKAKQGLISRESSFNFKNFKMRKMWIDKIINGPAARLIFPLLFAVGLIMMFLGVAATEVLLTDGVSFNIKKAISAVLILGTGIFLTYSFGKRTADIFSEAKTGVRIVISLLLLNFGVSVIFTGAAGLDLLLNKDSSSGTDDITLIVLLLGSGCFLTYYFGKHLSIILFEIREQTSPVLSLILSAVGVLLLSLGTFIAVFFTVENSLHGVLPALQSAYYVAVGFFMIFCFGKRAPRRAAMKLLLSLIIICFILIVVMLTCARGNDGL